MLVGADYKSNSILNYTLLILSNQKINLITYGEALSLILVEWNGW